MRCQFFERVCALLFRCCGKCESAAKPSSTTTPLPRGRGTRPIKPSLVVFFPELNPTSATGDAIQVALRKLNGWEDFEKSDVVTRIGGISKLAPRPIFKDWVGLEKLATQAEANYQKAVEKKIEAPFGVRGPYTKLEYKKYVRMSIPAGGGSKPMDVYCELKSELKRLLAANVYFSMPTKPAGALIDCRAAAPDGVGVNMTIQQYDGTGEWIVDIDRGWVMDSISPSSVRDLRVPPTAWADPSTSDDKKHGTAVAGIILGGTDPTTGTKIVDGIASGATFVKGLSIDFSNPSEPIDMLPSTITDAATYLSQNAPPHAFDPSDPSDIADPFDPSKSSRRTGVILIELEDNGMPVEGSQLVFDVIRTVVLNGHIVVQPAGNAGELLDDLIADHGRKFGDTSAPTSGAITVAAASTGEDVDFSGTTILKGGRSNVSNYGRLVDCWAWGDSIKTLGAELLPTSTNQYYTFNVPVGFGQTSGASAVVAGAILLMQQARREAGQPRLRADQLHALLEDDRFGTPGAGDLKGKYMPDLAKLQSTLQQPIPILPIP